VIALVDYGLGNIQAFANIYRRLNIPVTVARTPEEVVKAEKIILPGVGAFDWAMTRLNQSGMRECLDDLAKVHKRPVLGVCVGMQMMAARSEEGRLPGLGWIVGEVRRFDEKRFRQKTQLPHMGWNNASPKRNDGLFKGLHTNPRFYFLHSYYFACDRADDVLALTDYDGEFASAVQSGNAFGVQFHPEKSHRFGIELLKNFADL
jgi:imidazole glycerol-phosphate synthase subunit HisH